MKLQHHLLTLSLTTTWKRDQKDNEQRLFLRYLRENLQNLNSRKKERRRLRRKTAIVLFRNPQKKHNQSSTTGRFFLCNYDN